MPRAQIKDEKTYRALRREGNSEEKSARIANAAAASSRSEVAARSAEGQGTSVAATRRTRPFDRRRLFAEPGAVGRA
jgi:hypothetical protein